MASSTRPNLLFVFADQLRARELDHPDHPLLTPAYDRLRAEGARLTNTVANCPVCTPSRGILLTGQYPLRNNVLVNDLPLPESAETIGELTRDAGYRTGYIGKWHLDGVPRGGFTPPGPRRHGFDHWRVFNCIHNYFHSFYYDDDPEPKPIPGYEPEFQTDLACEFITGEAAREAPWCLFLSWGPPHSPYDQVPAWHAGLYPPERLTPPPNWQPPDLGLVAEGYGPAAVGANADRPRSLCQYYAAVSALDQQLMRLLDQLDATDQAANTIVVYTSDHGDMLWSHGRTNKQQPFDESVHIPFVIRWPEAIPAGVDNPSCLGVVDFAPTLLSLLGLAPPTAMQGTDLAANLRGETREAPASSFIFDYMAVDQGLAQSVPPWRGVRTQRHTYARLQDGSCWVLYDNLADPYQLANLADEPGSAGLRQALEAELQRWLTAVDDDFADGETLLRRRGLIPLWNARERELRGPRARILEEA